ncbi:uncharacterized protein MYCFIDRAFT_173100 [Pseudocercospora fijiensis CIRAD86]|uniref:Uncharacterized protein n=1 Tax=Pseudocercospora fijiensis (strain CIRAD86) TaxID=383855 RepID=M3B3T7_PSEFD|nr:uncharacterized protein MYCFIDRAFT_173100 [Pseudocercospora fijiensis CIRAD86]EME84037.1 hypothetical protein MYCFIDRAFT_173100 [Pseudocercospora fijiensis CIRAD86]
MAILRRLSIVLIYIGLIVRPSQARISTSGTELRGTEFAVNAGLGLRAIMIEAHGVFLES